MRYLVIQYIHIEDFPSRGYTLNYSVLLANLIACPMIAAPVTFAPSQSNVPDFARYAAVKVLAHSSHYAGELPGVATTSSEALFIDRYAVQKIPTVDTKGCLGIS